MADARLMVVVREAEQSDSRPIWQWRNDPTTRAVSRGTDPVPWDGHVEWFAKVLVDPRCHLLVAVSDELPVGVVRFDATERDGEWMVSLNLRPEARGKGLAAPVLDAGWEWLAGRAPTELVIANIRPTNIASVRAFESAGYLLAGEHDGWLRYERSAPRGSVNSDAPEDE